MQSKKLFIINVVSKIRKQYVLKVGIPSCKKLLQEAKLKVMFNLTSF